MLKKKDIILVFVVLGLIASNLIHYNKLKSIEYRMDQMNYLQTSIQDVNHSVQQISSRVDLKLDEFLQEQLWIREKDFEIINIDIPANQIEVALDWSLRELSDDESLSFLYREEKEQEWTELEVSSTGHLSYSLSLMIPLRGNYETQLLATSAGGKRSETLFPLHFQEQLETRIQTYATIHQMDNRHFDIHVDIYNSLENELSNNNEGFKIKSAKAFLYEAGEVRKEINLLEEHSYFHSDGYRENFSYHGTITLEEQVNSSDVELIVIIEDNYGFIFETKERMY